MGKRGRRIGKSHSKFGREMTGPLFPVHRVWLEGHRVATRYRITRFDGVMTCCGYIHIWPLLYAEGVRMNWFVMKMETRLEEAEYSANFIWHDAYCIPFS